MGSPGSRAGLIPGAGAARTGSVGAVTDPRPSDSAPTHRLEARRTLAASPARIFAVLCDPDGHVAIDSSGMLQSAEGPRVSREGDRFVVHMDREALGDYDLGRYDVTVIITRFEEDVEIAWTIDGDLKPPIGHVYGYRLTAADGGTDVLSYYDWSDAHPDWRDSGVLPVLDATALRATLGILDRAVTRGYVRG